MSKKTVYLRNELQQAWAGKNVFTWLASLPGEIFRDKEGRRTLRFELAGKSYFLKYHRGIGWAEIIKNWLSLRQPVVSARNEWEAIRFLERHGIETMTLAGYGETGFNPATRHSFVITDDLTQTMSLEFVGEQWRERPPTFNTKYHLLQKLAHIAGTMHWHGMNHRDFYLCHFLLDQRFAQHNTFEPETPLYLIDLHRATIRQSVPRRWQVKDLGSLYFSASRVPLTLRDKLRFMRWYSGLPLRQLLAEQADFWQQVERRSQNLLMETKKP